MNARILEVNDRTDLKRWVRFPYTHYRGDKYYIPQLIADELAYFDEKRNPAFETAQVKLFLVTDEENTLGRVCGIVNQLEADKIGYKRGRFGWFESVDDQNIANSLLDAVKHWLSTQGCIEMTGPHGFTDLDVEGLLIEGFDHLPTISGSYNYPYYDKLFANYGLSKEVDYVEYRCKIPQEFPLFERLRKRYAGNDRYRVVTCRSRKELLTHIDSLWKLLEQAFEPLYGVVPLSKKQTDFYTKKYFGFLDPDFVKLTYTREAELVGFFIGIPNLSRGFHRAGGRLFPFGFLHILKDYRWPKTVDFLLAGVKPGEASAVLTAITFIDMYDTLRKRDVQYMETNRELEGNTTVNRIWLNFDKVYYRRSRIYKLTL